MTSAVFNLSALQAESGASRTRGSRRVAGVRAIVRDNPRERLETRPRPVLALMSILQMSRTPPRWPEPASPQG